MTRQPSLAVVSSILLELGVHTRLNAITPDAPGVDDWLQQDSLTQWYFYGLPFSAGTLVYACIGALTREELIQTRAYHKALLRDAIEACYAFLAASPTHSPDKRSLLGY